MRPCNTRLVSEEKGDAPIKCVSHILGTHISLLLNMHKKECPQIILHEILLAPTRTCLLEHIHHVCVPMDILRAWYKKHHMEHKLSDIFESLRLSWV
jgi:hypothetical protein